MKRITISVFFSVFLGLFPVGGQTSEDYAIDFDYSSRAGAKYHISGEETEIKKGTMSEAGIVKKTQDVTSVWKFEGNVEVLEKSEKGDIVKRSIKVGKLSFSKNGNQQELLEAGAVIKALSSNEVTKYYVGDQELPAPLAAVLEKFLAVKDPNEPSDNEVFGTKDRKKTGDTWEIMPEQALRYLKAKGLSVSKDDFKGSTKLDEVMVVDGRKYLKVSGRFEFKNINGQLPSGMQLKTSEAEARFSMVLPVQMPGPSIEKSTASTLKYQAEGKTPEGRVTEMNRSFSGKSVVRYTYE